MRMRREGAEKHTLKGLQNSCKVRVLSLNKKYQYAHVDEWLKAERSMQTTFSVLVVKQIEHPKGPGG